MKIKSFIAVMLLFLLFGCFHSKAKKYKLTDEQLAHLMLDIQLAETTLTDLIPGQKDSIKILFNARLSEIYHLTPEEIKAEVDQLQSDQDKLKLIVNREKEIADSIQ